MILVAPVMLMRRSTSWRLAQNISQMALGVSPFLSTRKTASLLM